MPRKEKKRKEKKRKEKKRKEKKRKEKKRKEKKRKEKKRKRRRRQALNLEKLELGPSFPWPFSHLSDRSGKKGGGLSLPPACCDTVIGICFVYGPYGLLYVFETFQGIFFFMMLCRQDMACMCNFLSVPNDWCLVMPRSTNVVRFVLYTVPATPSGRGLRCTS